MKKIIAFPHLKAKDLCAVALLAAITAVLAIYGTFRIGNQIKIPIKFISVFIVSAFYGPWLGGFCGMLGDILNSVLMPVGPWLPQLSALEFLSGFVYGLFFFLRKTSGGGYVVRCALCALVQFLIDMFAVSAVLTAAGYFASFPAAFYIRIVPGIIKFFIQSAVMIAGCSYLGLIAKIRRNTYEL